MMVSEYDEAKEKEKKRKRDEEEAAKARKREEEEKRQRTEKWVKEYHEKLDANIASLLSVLKKYILELEKDGFIIEEIECGYIRLILGGKEYLHESRVKISSLPISSLRTSSRLWTTKIFGTGMRINYVEASPSYYTLDDKGKIYSEHMGPNGLYIGTNDPNEAVASILKQAARDVVDYPLAAAPPKKVRRKQGPLVWVVTAIVLVAIALMLIWVR